MGSSDLPASPVDHLVRTQPSTEELPSFRLSAPKVPKLCELGVPRLTPSSNPHKECETHPPIELHQLPGCDVAQTVYV